MNVFKSALMAFSIGFALCGCDSRPENEPAKLPEAPEMVPANEVVQFGQTIPDEFPKDVPLYENWTIRQVSAIARAGTYDVEAVSTESPAEIAEHLRAAAKSQGWQEKDTSGTPGDTLYMATFIKESRSLTITIMRQERDSIIHVTTG
ncbi:MAG: hypothetical protein AMXMBFR84_12250 [Candidatus Hydrogenedentota bacterium]